MPVTQPSSALTNAAPEAWPSLAILPRRRSTEPPCSAMSIGAGPSSPGLAGAVHGGHQPMKTAWAGLIALKGPGYTLGDAAGTRLRRLGLAVYCSAKIGCHVRPDV